MRSRTVVGSTARRSGGAMSHGGVICAHDLPVPTSELLDDVRTCGRCERVYRCVQTESGPVWYRLRGLVLTLWVMGVVR